MKSMGCIVMDREDFAEFASIAKRKGDLAIGFAPVSGSHLVEFRIIPRTADAVSF
jgi:hypothetical protein